MAHGFEAFEVIAGQTLWLKTVEEVASEVGISRALFQHMVEDHQQGMAHRYQGWLLPAARPTVSCGGTAPPR